MHESPRADHGVFSISVASELTGVQPQALRGYESNGLVVPFRTAGGTRRYSADDLDRIQRISVLLAAGLNHAGVRQVLELQDEAVRLRAELQTARDEAPRSGGTLGDQVV